MTTKRNFTIPRAGNAGVHIDPAKKAKLKKRVEAPATPDTFKLVARAKQIGARLSGATVEVGTGARNAGHEARRLPSRERLGDNGLDPLLVRRARAELARARRFSWS